MRSDPLQNECALCFTHYPLTVCYRNTRSDLITNISQLSGGEGGALLLWLPGFFEQHCKSFPCHPVLIASSLHGISTCLGENPPPIPLGQGEF